MENKKIKNAKVCSNGDIDFRSFWEKRVYSILLSQGFDPQYEPKTFTLWEGFTPIIPFYDHETIKQNLKRRKILGKTVPRGLVLKRGKILGIKYTPDFYLVHNGINVYIEAKGIENDVFYIKKKMFIKYLGDRLLNHGEKSMYFEVYNKHQLLQAIEEIRNYGQEENKGIDKES